MACIERDADFSRSKKVRYPRYTRWPVASGQPINHMSRVYVWTRHFVTLLVFMCLCVCVSVCRGWRWDRGYRVVGVEVNRSK